MASSRGRRFIVSAVLGASVLSVSAGPAHADLSYLMPITCTAAGTVTAVDGGSIDTWTVAGTGSCQGDFGGTYLVNFAGTGTSQGLGLCDGSLLVRNLEVVIHGTLTNPATGIPEPLQQFWFGDPLTTYPLATPFVVTGLAGINYGLGAGSFFTHVFLNCTGSPVAQFTWAFQKPFP